MKTQISKQHTNVVAVQPQTTRYKEGRTKNTYPMRTLWAVVLYLVVATCTAFAAEENYTCRLNLDLPAGGGLYSGTLVDSNGVAVGTCVGSAPLSPLVVQQLVPTLCTPGTYNMDCSGASTLGELHNQALLFVIGDHPIVLPNPPPDWKIPTVQAFVQHLSPWMQVSPAFKGRNSDADIALLTQQITAKLQAAGIVDEGGRFTEDALTNTSRVAAYLEQSGKVSPGMSAILQRLADGASAAAVTKLLQGQQWTGNDRMAAAIISNVAISSEQYFQTSLRQTYIKPGPTYWDVVGGLLTWELGPGALVGGYLMSAASCFCTSF